MVNSRNFITKTDNRSFTIPPGHLLHFEEDFEGYTFQGINQVKFDQSRGKLSVDLFCLDDDDIDLAEYRSAVVFHSAYNFPYPSAPPGETFSDGWYGGYNLDGVKDINNPNRVLFTTSDEGSFVTARNEVMFRHYSYDNFQPENGTVSYIDSNEGTSLIVGENSFRQYGRQNNALSLMSTAWAKFSTGPDDWDRLTGSTFSLYSGTVISNSGGGNGQQHDENNFASRCDGSILMSTSNGTTQSRATTGPTGEEIFFTGVSAYGQMIVGFPDDGFNLPFEFISEDVVPYPKLSIAPYTEAYDTYSLYPGLQMRHLIAANRWSASETSPFANGTFCVTEYGEMFAGVAATLPIDDSYWDSGALGVADYWYQFVADRNTLYMESDTTRCANIFSFSVGNQPTDVKMQLKSDGKLTLNKSNGTPNASLDIVSHGSTNATAALEVTSSSATTILQLQDNGNLEVVSVNADKGTSGYVAPTGTRNRNISANGTSTITVSQLAEAFAALLDDLLAKGIIQ